MSGASRLLVVEDDVSLLQLLQKYLTRLGYEVEACTRGNEAWSQFESRPDEFALVMADLNLADMPGEELLRRILRLSPRTPVLVCSGYPFNPATLAESGQNVTSEESPMSSRERVVATAQADQTSPPPWRVGFLQKPFLPKMLADAVADLLAGRDAVSL